MKPHRFTLRTLMIAVAIAIALAALATWGWMLLLRSREFAGRASYHNAERLLWEDMYSANYDFRRRHGLSTASDQSWIAFRLRQALYHDRMCHKYRRAALFPWLATSPDPAPPEQPKLPPDFRWW